MPPEGVDPLSGSLAALNGSGPCDEFALSGEREACSQLVMSWLAREGLCSVPVELAGWHHVHRTGHAPDNGVSRGSADCDEPHDAYLDIEIVGAVSCTERRQYLRTRKGGPVGIVAPGHQPEVGKLIDISEGGMRFSVGEASWAASIDLLTARMKLATGWYDFPGHVVRRMDRQGFVEISLQFAVLPEKQARAVRSFVLLQDLRESQPPE